MVILFWLNFILHRIKYDDRKFRYYYLENLNEIYSSDIGRVLTRTLSEYTIYKIEKNSNDDW